MAMVSRRGIVLRRGEGQVSVVLKRKAEDSGLFGDVSDWARTRWANVKKSIAGSRPSVGKRSEYAFLMLAVVVVALFVWTVYDIRESEHVQETFELPYPYNIATEVRSGRGLVWDSDEEGNHSGVRFPVGYGDLRAGTFRDVDSSKESRDSPNRYGAFDEIFVITNSKCPDQMSRFSRKAEEWNLKFTKIDQSKDTPSLYKPPIPVNLDGPVERLTLREKALVLQNLAYTVAHRDAWQRMVDKQRQRAMIIDDTLFLKERIVEGLPEMFAQVDQESVSGALSWHLIFFRRMILEQEWSVQNESIWEGSEGTWTAKHRPGHPIVRAKPSYGAGAYAISLQGARWLLEHVKEYREPLDEQISSLQRQYSREFVSLSACKTDRQKSFCSENIDDLTDPSDSEECRWRRIEEKKLTARLDG